MGRRRRRQRSGLGRIRHLATEKRLAVGNVLLGAGRIRLVNIRRLAGFAQELSKPADGFLVAIVLLVAAALVVEVGGVVAGDVQLRQDLHPLGRVAVQTSAPRRAFFGVVAGSLSRRHQNGEREQ